MPKISQITTASAPSLSDKLIGTSVGGSPSNQTNNFTLQEIKQLFDGGSPSPSPTLQSVLNAGNTAIQNIYLTGELEAIDLTIANDASSKNLYLAERFFDRNNSAGTNGQYLTSTGSGVQWSTLTIPIPTLQQVLTAGNVSDKDITTTGNIQGANIEATNITANSNLRVVGTLSDSTNSVGGTGQVLSSTGTGTDWVDLPSYSAVSPLIYNNVLKQFSIQQANSTQNGYLSSADWITFDGKQNAGNYITALTGEASASGPGSVNITLNNLAVINKTLTGFTALSGVVTGADSIITAFGKVQGQINGIVAGVVYQGVWNAATNTPVLVSGVGVQGHYYVVDVAGNTNLDGITDWQIGDWAIFNGADWQKVDNTDAVVSVNGQIGIVVLNTDNINEGSNNLYYTNTRARNAISSLATGLTYTASTGVFSLTAGYSIPTIANQTDWTTAYNETIVSAAVTGTTTKTLTLTQQDGGTITADWNEPDLTGYVPYTGATQAVELGYNALTSSFLRVDGAAPTSGGYLGFKHATTVNTGAEGYTSMYTFGTNTIGFKSVSGATNKDFSFDMSTITSNVAGGRVYSMPDANGTLALTSDIPSVSDFVTKSTDQTITGLKTIVRSGDVLDFKIGTDTLYGLKLFYSQNELVPNGEATWSFVNTFNRDGVGYETTPLSFFRGILVTGDRLLSSSINANLLDYYANNPTGRYPVYAYNTGVQQFASSIIVGEQAGVVNPITGAISDLPAGVVANFNGRAIGSDAVNSNEFVTLGQVSSATGYVPYTGALANVDLGTYGLLSDFVQFNLAPTSLPTAQGTMYWDADKETLDVVLNGTTGSIFQDTFFFVKNQTGASIPKGTVVRAAGTLGNSGRILITPFLADGTYDSKFCLGVTNETIGNGEDGRVTYFGSIRGIDTSLYPAGTVLYASPNTVGGFTATEPTGPTNNIISVAIVVNSHNNNGSIFVRPTFIPSAIDLSKSLGYTPANAATTLTINGTTYDLSANRAWSVGTVTSVDMSVPTGFTIGNNPITSSGTLALGYDSGYSLPTNASQANWDTAYANRITSLTTTGTSGVATLTSNVLNIPQYQGQGDYITALTGEVTASGPGSASATLSNSAVIGKVLTGLNVTGSAILDTDSILVAFGKLQNQVNQLVGGLKYDGTWDAATNTPTLASGVGTDGDFYIVNVAGSTNIDGITDWQVGDWIVFHTPSWQKVDNTDSVTSVFGRVGAVTAAQSDYSAFYPLIADIKNGVLTVQGDGVLGGSGTFSANQATNNTISITHDAVSRTNSTSTASPAFGGTFTAIDSITSSTEGHITAVNTKTVTIPNTTAPNNATITLSAGAGISGGGDFTTDQSVNETITFSHADTSAQASVNNSGRTFIQDITLDTYGHVTGLVSATDSDTFTGTVTSVSGAGGYGGLTLSGTVTTSGNINLGGTPSGTWPISISGNAETVDGFSASQSLASNTIVVRDPSGYIFGNYINMSDDGNPGGGTGISSFITKQGDNYYRSVSPTAAANSIRGAASGTWPISISGNAETVDGYSVSVSGVANTIPTRNSSGYLIPQNWIQLNDYYGLYAGLNSAHFYPNNNSYGSWKILGSKNGWTGLHFGDGTGMTLMMNETEFGFHRESFGWYARFTQNTGHFNISGSAQSASYANTVQVNYNNDSDSSYQMLWGSGNSVYGTEGIKCNPSTDTIIQSSYNPDWDQIWSLDTGRILYGYGTPSVGYKVTNPNPGWGDNAFMNAFGIEAWNSNYDYAVLNPNGVVINQSGSQGGGIGGGAYANYGSGGFSSYSFDATWGGSCQHFGDSIQSYANYYGEGFEWRAWDSGNLYIGGVLIQNHWSDAKYKENVVEIENALDKVKSIRGIEYDWNELALNETGREGHDVGVIAQEVQAVYPFAVREVDKEKDDHIQTALAVDYEKLIPLLIQSIKELSIEVDDLKSKLLNL